MTYFFSKKSSAGVTAEDVDVTKMSPGRGDMATVARAPEVQDSARRSGAQLGDRQSGRPGRVLVVSPRLNYLPGLPLFLP